MIKTKRFICLALLLAAFMLCTACQKDTPPAPTMTLATSSTAEGTSESTTDTNKVPSPEVMTAKAFAENLQKALAAQTKLHADFDIKETLSAEGVSLEFSIQSQIQADLSDRSAPLYRYDLALSMFNQKKDALIFYHDGYLYTKSQTEKIKEATDFETVMEDTPAFPLAALIGEDAETIFADASIQANADGTTTASAVLDTETRKDAILQFLSFIAGDYTESDEDGRLHTASLSVTIDKNGRICGYSMDAKTEFDLDEKTTAITFRIGAVCKDVSNGFSVDIPSEEIRMTYIEAEPEITEISKDDFMRRFRIASALSEKSSYAEVLTVGDYSYKIKALSVSISLHDLTVIDASDENNPLISVNQTVSSFGRSQNMQMYYKNGFFYYNIDGNKYKVSYPVDEFMANAEKSALENEGLESYFLTEAMLEGATLTVLEDQSVQASMTIDGETQKNNILYNIASVFDEDLSALKTSRVADTKITVTLDRYNRLKEYSIQTTLKRTMEGYPDYVDADYHITYTITDSDEPQEIAFPADLDSDHYADITDEYENGGSTAA